MTTATTKNSGRRFPRWFYLLATVLLLACSVAFFWAALFMAVTWNRIDTLDPVLTRGDAIRGSLTGAGIGSVLLFAGWATMRGARAGEPSA